MLQEGWKYIIVLSALIFVLCLSYRTLQPAHALNGPLTSYGDVPFKSWYVTSTSPFLTTSSNETFIITSIIQSDSSCGLKINNSYSFNTNWSFAKWGNDANQTASTTGNLRMVIGPNTSVQFDGSGCNSGQYVQGYFVHNQ